MSGRAQIRDALTRAAVTGSVANLLLTVGLAVAAEVEGKAPLRPLNATSHWRNGDAAGARGGADVAHTGVGLTTNEAACLFWAVPFEAWQAALPAPNRAARLCDALAMSAIAAAVDYGATPKRFTPGWELVLSPKGMVMAYAALAAGLALGTTAAQRPKRGLPCTPNGLRAGGRSR